MPAAPLDDPSIPVLTERLLLPELELDTTLPAAPADAPVAAPTPAAPADAPSERADTAPQVLGVHHFETDTWLVETPPVAPPMPTARPAAATPAAGEIAPAVSIPASLMREAVAAAVSDVATTTSGAASTRATTATAAPPPPPALSDAALLSASILDELLRQLPPDSESIVRRHLAPAVDAAIGAAVAQIVPEIRRAVALALRELVVQAVQAELARLRDRSRS
jgi:hypothetical protein